MPHDVRVARLERIVAAGFPQHVTQHGNRRHAILFEPADTALYRDLLAERCRKASIEVWAYCLMRNQVHLVLTSPMPKGDNDRVALAALRAAESASRPLGSGELIVTLERVTGRRLQSQKPGHRPSARTDQLELRMPGISGEG